MNVDIFILARLKSSRLPQKHLMKIDGKPLIKHLIDRLKHARKIRHIIVCTTNHHTDDLLVEFLEKENILFYRGDEKDILKRILKAAEKFDTDIIVDVEGDKIYTDPTFVDDAVREIENSKYDFVMGSDLSEDIDHTIHSIAAVFPAVIRKNSLEKICKIKNTNDTETGYREYFTSTNLFNCKYLSISNLQIPKALRLTLDYPEDFDFAKKIFKELGSNFKFEDIVKLVTKKPELLEITKPAIENWRKHYEKNFSKLLYKQK